jgi:hypothetical protein
MPASLCNAKLADTSLSWHHSTMSTLVEIESAVITLPLQQQESLLGWLQSQVSKNFKPATKATVERWEWLRRLAERRARGRTGQPGTPLQQIMDDLRGN